MYIPLIYWDMSLYSYLANIFGIMVVSILHGKWGNVSNRFSLYNKLGTNIILQYWYFNIKNK